MLAVCQQSLQQNSSFVHLLDGLQSLISESSVHLSNSHSSGKLLAPLFVNSRNVRAFGIQLPELALMLEYIMIHPVLGSSYMYLFRPFSKGKAKGRKHSYKFCWEYPNN